MTALILAEMSASVTELKRNTIATVAAGEGFPVAILDHDEPAFYCVPAKVFESMVERLDDIELNVLADARSGEQATKLALGDL